jgi:hypothetical protein
MQNFYKPIGNEKGNRITIPAYVKIAELYKFQELPDGTLQYTPVRT